MVYPSELARIARVEPVVPPAPAMFSMIICWPRARDMYSLTMRAVTSVPPPAGNGTIIVIGRDGYVCAVAICDTTDSTAALAARRGNCLRWGTFTTILPRSREGPRMLPDRAKGCQRKAPNGRGTSSSPARRMRDRSHSDGLHVAHGD